MAEEGRDYPPYLRDIGVHLAAKVFEQAVKDKSSMVN